MMRPTASCFALAALVASLAAGCSIIADCGPFKIEEREGVETLVVPLVADTLTVAFVWDMLDYPYLNIGDPREFEVAYGAAPTGNFRLRLDLRTTDYDDPERFFARGEVRGDTLFVRFTDADSLFRQACLPSPPSVILNAVRVEAPEGVRHVRFASVQENPYAARVAVRRSEGRPRVVRA